MTYLLKYLIPIFFFNFTLIGSEKNLTDDVNSVKDGSWWLITQHTGLHVTFPWPVERAVRDLLQSLTKKTWPKHEYKER